MKTHEQIVDEKGVNIRLSAQRALLGRVTASLRSVSVESVENVIKCKYIFASEPSDREKELVSESAAEIIADYPSPYTISEEIAVETHASGACQLKYVVYERYEA